MRMDTDPRHENGLGKLVAFYERKTDEILRRYGPGPRVHYHTGLIDEPRPPLGTVELQSYLVAAQEQMLQYASQTWNLRKVHFRDVLDVGCGLGGSAIFCAQEFGADITAITIAPSHVELVAIFAAEAGVGSRIKPLLCDALAMAGEDCFDAVLALDSSSSFARAPWFQRVTRLLRRRGHIFVFDCFLERPEYEEPFNSHWCARIGTLEEYLIAAREAGLEIEAIDDVSCRAAHFWTATLALLQEETRKSALTVERARKLRESLDVHALVRRGILEGGLRHCLLSFVKG
jgi:tocopherol O-methyltransferase